MPCASVEERCKLLRTWLPFPSYEKSAACLDWKRLYRQISDAEFLLKRKDSLAAMLWGGYEPALHAYHDAMLAEWVDRGYKTTRKMHDVDCYDFPTFPPALHACHRGNLLRKAPEIYGNFGWDDPPTDYLLWVDNHGRWFWQQQNSDIRSYVNGQSGACEHREGIASRVNRVGSTDDFVEPEAAGT